MSFKPVPCQFFWPIFQAHRLRAVVSGILGAFLFIAAPMAAMANQNDVSGQNAVSGKNGASAETISIVGFGDSLMAGYQLGPDEGFPQQLEKALKEKGFDISIANAGVSGDTTTGGLARLDWSVPDGTDLVILELGANDALRGISPDITEKNLDEMIKRLKARNTGVILAGMFAPPNMGEDYGKAFNAIYPRLAEKYGLPFYPFFLDGVTAQKPMLLEDGMHPNAQGVARMVEGFLPLAEEVIGGTKSGL